MKYNLAKLTYCTTPETKNGGKTGKLVGFINFVLEFLIDESKTFSHPLSFILRKGENEKWYGTLVNSKMGRAFVSTELESDLFDQCMTILSDLRKRHESYLRTKRPQIDSCTLNRLLHNRLRNGTKVPQGF